MHHKLICVGLISTSRSRIRLGVSVGIFAGEQGDARLLAHDDRGRCRALWSIYLCAISKQKETTAKGSQEGLGNLLIC